MSTGRKVLPPYANSYILNMKGKKRGFFLWFFFFEDGVTPWWIQKQTPHSQSSLPIRVTMLQPYLMRNGTVGWKMHSSGPTSVISPQKYLLQWYFTGNITLHFHFLDKKNATQNAKLKHWTSTIQNTRRHWYSLFFFLSPILNLSE